MTIVLKTNSTHAVPPAVSTMQDYPARICKIQ
jgi:hypothetical protein